MNKCYSCNIFIARIELWCEVWKNLANKFAGTASELLVIRSLELFEAPWVTPRSGFLKTTALAGAARSKSVAAKLNQPAFFQLQNRFFAIHFDLATGRFGVWRGDESPLWVNGAATATLPSGVRATSDSEYAREMKVVDFSGDLGGGRQLIASCFDGKRQLDFEVRVSLYDGREALTVETIARNVSKKPLVVGNVESVQELDGGVQSGAKTILPGEVNKSSWNTGPGWGN